MSQHETIQIHSISVCRRCYSCCVLLLPRGNYKMKLFQGSFTWTGEVMKNRIRFDYEGLGSCISADLYLSNIKVLNINSNGTEFNDLTEEAIEVLHNYFK